MIKQAIIPLAGLGTRLLPLSSVIPKELLPINGKPGLEYIIDECVEAGIKEIIFIISDQKKMIKKYFYNDLLYKKFFQKKKDKRILYSYKKILKYKKMIKFVYQNKPLGTGDAILRAKKLIKNNFFLMLLPDDLIMNENCSNSMIKIHNKYKSSVIAGMNVNKKNVSRWGIFNLLFKISNKNYLIKDVIEKPSIKNAPSNKAVIGRYILPKKIFSILTKLTSGQGDEIHITDAIRTLIKNDNKFICHLFSGKYLDCGTMKGYIKSSIEISKL